MPTPIFCRTYDPLFCSALTPPRYPFLLLETQRQVVVAVGVAMVVAVAGTVVGAGVVEGGVVVAAAVVAGVVEVMTMMLMRMMTEGGVAGLRVGPEGGPAAGKSLLPVALVAVVVLAAAAAAAITAVAAEAV